MSGSSWLQDPIAGSQTAKSNGCLSESVERRLFILPSARGTWPWLSVEESPAIVGGQEGGLPRATGGTPGWLNGTAPYWVWSAWIPGSGRDLALLVWLSPDTTGPAMKKPRQNNPALDRGQPIRNTLFVQGLEVEEGGPRQEGPRDFQGRGFTLT